MRAFHHRFSFQDYLRLEEDSNTKHEFFGGEIVAMGGGTPEHSALAVAVTVALGVQLRGRPCRVYNSDLRIRSLATGLATYPDVSVVCGPARYDPESRNTVVNPTVIVEVLSDSTEEYDLNEKFESYRAIPSLQEYVVVSHRETLIAVHRRGDGVSWVRAEAGARATVKLESIGCELQVDPIYSGIDLHREG